MLDVGCGSGILSLFAAQAGARKVYAIEASNVAESARLLAAANNLDGVITVIQAKIEDITSATIPFNSVDIIVSEPIGTYLLNERMLETYVIARDKFLKPDGRMFPKSATLYIAPFEDSEIYNEQLQKCDFWGTTDFYGLDLSVLKEKSITEKFSQPILDTYNPKKK